MRLTKMPLEDGADYLVKAEDEQGEIVWVVGMWMGERFLSYFDSETGEDRLHRTTVLGYKKLEGRK